MPGVLETGVSPPVLVETLWTSARGAIRHPSLRFGMSIIPTSSPRASRHLSRRFRRPSRYSRFISRHSCPFSGHSRESGNHGGGRSAPQSRTDLQDDVC